MGRLIQNLSKYSQIRRVLSACIMGRLKIRLVDPVSLVVFLLPHVAKSSLVGILGIGLIAPFSASTSPLSPLHSTTSIINSCS